MDGITGYGKHTGNKQRVHLNSGEFTQYGKDSYYQQDIMDQGDNGAGAPAEGIGHFAESKADVEQNCYRGNYDRDDGITHCLAGYNRGYCGKVGYRYRCVKAFSQAVG